MNRILPGILLALLLIAGFIGYLKSEHRANAAHDTSQSGTTITNGHLDECKTLDEIGHPTVGVNGYIVVMEGKMAGFVHASKINQLCNPFN